MFRYLRFQGRGRRNMAQLTDEQVKKAAEAYAETWMDSKNFDMPTLRLECLRAAAPHLQLPWDDPSNEELETLYREVPYGCGHRLALQYFVRRRNAALLPKPPKTLDVDRARGWLIDNHPEEECRHLAELLHDYALSVTETK